jgi:putative inorganic carbon (HCO3(-)) transporter
MGFSFKSGKTATNFSARRVLDRLIEIVYLTTIFLVPLWFAYLLPTYNIFELNKMALFRVLVSVLFALTALKLVFYPPGSRFSARSFFRKYWLWPLVFLAGLGLSLLFSDNPGQSFYGTLERQTGYASYLFFGWWFILVSFNLLTVRNGWAKQQEETDPALSLSGNIRRVISAAVWSGLLVSIYAVLQVLNIDFLVWPEPAYLTHRAFSTFGQPNFLASWLLFVIPLSIYIFITSRSFLVRSFFLSASVIQLIALFLSGSRGGLLALLATAALGLAYRLVSAAWSKRRKFLIIGLFLLLALVSLAGLDLVSRGRIRELADLRYGSFAARGQLYVSALEAISQKPFFGHGLENGEDIFIRYYSSDWGVYGNINQTADRAHNLILDILLATGFFGIILYSILFWFIFRLIKEALRSGPDRLLILALAAGLSAYFLSLFLSFTIVVGEIYAWLFLAVLVAYQAGHGHPLSSPDRAESLFRPERKRIWLRPMSVLLVVLIAVFLIRQAVRDVRADYYFNQAYYAVASGDYATALVLGDYQRAERVNPISQDSYDRFWGDGLSLFYSGTEELVIRTAIRKKLEQADSSLPPAGFKNLLAKAKINTTLGDFSKASAYLAALIRISPFWPAAYLEAGRLDQARGDGEAALVDYYQASLNLPDPADARLNDQHKRDVLNFRRLVSERIASLYMSQANYGAAEKYYRAAYMYQPEDFTLLKDIANTYYLRGDLANAIRYNERGFQRSPHDYHWPLALAALYRLQGDEATSKIYIERARRLAPDSPELLAWPDSPHNQE